METGELSMENMETLTELGDELTLGDIDGERGGCVRGLQGRTDYIRSRQLGALQLLWD